MDNHHGINMIRGRIQAIRDVLESIELDLVNLQTSNGLDKKQGRVIKKKSHVGVDVWTLSKEGRGPIPKWVRDRESGANKYELMKKYGEGHVFRKGDNGVTT